MVYCSAVTARILGATSAKLRRDRNGSGMAARGGGCSHPGCGQLIGVSEAAGAGLMRCTKCRRRIYCSKECQKAGWKGGHKQECERLREGAEARGGSGGAAEGGQGALDGELERLRREVTALQEQSRLPSGPEGQDYVEMKEKLEVQAQKRAQAEIEDAQKRFSVMASAMRNQIEAESKCADELRAALAAAREEPAQQECPQGPGPVTSSGRLKSLLEDQLMKQAEALSLKDSRIAELEEEVTLLKRKGNLLRLAPGVAQVHDRTPSFAESLSGAEEDLPEGVPAWLREEKADSGALEGRP